MDNQKYIKNVVTLDYDASKCNGCRMCIEVCPHNVFIMAGRKAELIDRDRCIECGACALNCNTGALTVNQGVGCAAAVISGFFKGTEPTCGCDSGGSC
ncbi:MAG: ferredoxin [Bacteroidetes bacterium]|nr:ferredoxin [Bacteroidota bacterium]